MCSLRSLLRFFLLLEFFVLLCIRCQPLWHVCASLRLLKSIFYDIKIRMCSWRSETYRVKSKSICNSSLNLFMIQNAISSGANVQFTVEKKYYCGISLFKRVKSHWDIKVFESFITLRTVILKFSSFLIRKQQKKTSGFVVILLWSP